MKIIRVIYYRAERDGHIKDDAIAWWTGLFNWGTGPYAHTEICLPDEECNFDKGLCFTSTMRGEAKGLVSRSTLDVIKYPERWDYMEIEVDDNLLRDALWMARMLVKYNQGYDRLMIASFFFPVRFGSPGKMICSVFVQIFLFWCGVFNKRFDWSPRRLSARLATKGYEIKHW